MAETRPGRIPGRNFAHQGVARSAIAVAQATIWCAKARRDRHEGMGRRRPADISPQVTSRSTAAVLGGAVTTTDTYNEVADPGNQARWQTEKPYANRRVLDQDIHKHEDDDPKPPGQFD